MLYLIVSETLDESEENVTIFTDVLAADSTFRHENPRPITNEQVRCARLEVCMLLSGDFGKNPPAKRAENSVGSVGLESSAHEEENR
ncbi:hypothetical protein ANTRET_LOCUS10039 [Anthophora retusa]